MVKKQDICKAIGVMSLLLVSFATKSWAQSNPPRITSIAPANGKVIIRWQGGAGPSLYQLQMRTTLGAGWQDVGQLTSATSVTNAMTGNSAFYRIKCVTNSAPPPPPTPMQLAGFMPALSVARDVCVSGNYALVAVDKFGLSVVDVSNPNAPALVSSLNVPIDGSRLAVGGTTAVVTGMRQFYEGGQLKNVSCFYVVDVSLPLNPTVVGAIESETLGFADVAISGDYAYAACTTAGMKVIDLHDRSRPTIVGTYDTAGSAYALTVAGNYAYVADGLQGLTIINISNPAAPFGVSSLDTPGNAKDVFVAGTLAYLADSTSLQILDVRNPSAPAFKGSYTGWAYQVKVQNGVAYLATTTTGLVLLDVNNAASPIVLTSLPPTGGPNPTTLGVYVVGSQVYLANGSAGLGIVNVASSIVSTPTLTQTGNVAEWFNGYKVAAKPGLAVIAGTKVWNGGYQNSYGLRLLNTANPADPYLIGKLDTSSFNFYGLAIFNNYVFVACGVAGMKVVDISNPAQPTIVATYDTPGWANAVALSGNYAYVADGAQGLRIINISNPLAPLSVGFLDTPGNAKDVTVVGSLAYVADNTSVQIIDVSNPNTPVNRGAYGVTALEVKVQNGVAYVAASVTGLVTLDVNNPASPRFLASLPPSGGINPTTVAVSVAGSRVCLANGAAGMTLVNVANPAAPTVSASVVTSGSASGVLFDGSWICLSDTLGTLNTIWVGP